MNGGGMKKDYLQDETMFMNLELLKFSWTRMPIVYQQILILMIFSKLSRHD